MRHLRNIRLVVNPASGRGKGRRLAAALGRQLAIEGFRVETCSTLGPGDASRYCTEAASRGFDMLTVVGGDGTVNEAINSAPEVGLPILIGPAGTENLLAGYLGINADIDQLCSLVRMNRRVRLDVPSVNGRRFVMVAGIGFDAEVVRRLSRSRTGPIGHASYFWPAWRTFWGYPQPWLKVEVDGRPFHEGRGLLLAGNIPRYALRLGLLRRASPFDGLLDVCFFEFTWQVPLLWHALKAALGRHVGTPGVHYAQARRARVISDGRTPVEVDGDPGGTLPAEFDACAGHATFLVSPWMAERLDALRRSAVE
jgi:YegS/Rv2252/BmrU family lipid kinase